MEENIVNLFGDDFKVDFDRSKTKKAVKKAEAKPVSEMTDEEIKKAIKSKKLSVQERLSILAEKVLKVLGKQRNNVVVLRSKAELNAYIDKCIENNFASVDSESNNSLDPTTAMLMGLCLHTRGMKQAYCPVNHVDPETKIRLPWQCTERDIYDALQRLKDAHTFVVMHNGKFDYEIFKKTCGVELAPDWDTIVGARLIDENEEAGLKSQYVNHIDPTQAKYDIEGLFLSLPYKYIDPAIFALYASTDAKMTTTLYDYQKPIMEAKGNEKLYWLFKNIEMPIVRITADMELRGVKVDMAFRQKMHDKLQGDLDEIDAKIQEELKAIEPQIKEWRLTKEANAKTKYYVPKKSKMSKDKIEAMYTEIDEKGNRFKYGKAKAEQLEESVNMASPAQLAILLYDVLKAPVVDKKNPRATGEEQLKEIYEKANIKLCDLILDRRGLVKLLSTYIDNLPPLMERWKDGRLRAHFNSLGTETGRYSSGGKVKFMDDETDEAFEIPGVNLQNIPAKHGYQKEIRLLYCGDTLRGEVEGDGRYEVPEYEEVMTPGGWKYAGDLKAGDEIEVDGKPAKVSKVEIAGQNRIIYT